MSKPSAAKITRLPCDRPGRVRVAVEHAKSVTDNHSCQDSSPALSRLKIFEMPNVAALCDALKKAL